MGKVKLKFTNLQVVKLLWNNVITRNIKLIVMLTVCGEVSWPIYIYVTAVAILLGTFAINITIEETKELLLSEELTSACIGFPKAVDLADTSQPDGIADIENCIVALSTYAGSSG